MVLGPIWIIILWMFKGYTYCENFGFVPGDFNIAVFTTYPIYAGIFYTTYLLMMSRLDDNPRFYPESGEPVVLDLIPYCVMITMVFFR